MVFWSILNCLITKNKNYQRSVNAPYNTLIQEF